MQFPITNKFPNLNKQELFQKINDLKTCPLKNAGIKVVYPIGDGSSGVMLIGEAPGAKEDELGEPFVGASGKFLNNTLLPSVDLNRENIYLTNIVKCRPPLNRDPSEKEKLAWSEILLMEILTVKPKIIACLGRHSLSFFMPEAKISEVHGKVFEIEILKGLKQKVLPLYHPAVALYNPGMRPKLIEDFGVLKGFLG
jgi:DNA polymerase